jgi:hypothetical protein
VSGKTLHRDEWFSLQQIAAIMVNLPGGILSEAHYESLRSELRAARDYAATSKLVHRVWLAASIELTDVWEREHARREAAAKS